MSFYAYFTDKGDITQISNVLDVNSTDMHINIDEEMFVAFSEERINYLNYKVISGPKDINLDFYPSWVGKDRIITINEKLTKPFFKYILQDGYVWKK